MTSSATRASTPATRWTSGSPSSSIHALSWPIRRLLPPAMIAAETLTAPSGRRHADARQDERRHAGGVVEPELRDRRTDREVRDRGDEVAVVGAEELGREGGPRDLDLRERLGLEPFDHQEVEVVASVGGHGPLERELVLPSRIVDDRDLAAPEDDRLRDAGPPDPVAVLLRTVDLEAGVGVLHVSDPDTASDDQREHRDEQRRLAAVVPADERDPRRLHAGQARRRAASRSSCRTSRRRRPACRSWSSTVPSRPASRWSGRP